MRNILINIILILLIVYMLAPIACTCYVFHLAHQPEIRTEVAKVLVR